MTEIFQYLSKLPGPYSVLALALILLIILSTKPEVLSRIFKQVNRGSRKSKEKNDTEKDDVEKKLNTYGDSVLILLGIRERYQHEFERMQNNLLRSQMKFAEQKIQEIIFTLSGEFCEDIQIVGGDEEYHTKAIESTLYCEALKNAMLSVKDELRCSFKENGFSNFSEVEYANYISNKTTTVLTIIRSYLKQHYVDDEKTIMHLKSRFDKMKSNNSSLFRSWLYSIFSHAKDVDQFTSKSMQKTKEDLKAEIDEFIKRSPCSRC